MYKVGRRDRVAKLSDLPPPNVGAPIPAVVATEHKLDVIYFVQESVFKKGGYSHDEVRVMNPKSEGSLVARVSLHWPMAHMFGLPCENTIEAHPLASRGLHPCATWEVTNSSWIRDLARVLAAYEHADPSGLDSYRHLIFAFHDSTFECVARSYDIKLTRDSIVSAAHESISSW